MTPPDGGERIYGGRILEHFRRPRHARPLERPDVSEEGVNPLCGDRVRMELLVRDDAIVDAGFTANACAICTASASLLTERLAGMSTSEAAGLTPKEQLALLETPIPEGRLSCATLPLETLQRGLRRLARSDRAPPATAVAGVLLAAGKARRFGSQKLVAALGGKTVVWHAASCLVAAGLDPIVVVVGADQEAVRIALDGLPVQYVENARYEEGQSTSVVAAIEALGGKTGPSAAVLALGDQPAVSPDCVKQLVALHRGSGAPIVVPVYDGARGNPVLFHRAIFPELLALTGDVGARELIERDPSRVARLDIPAPMPRDVDTPEDLVVYLSDATSPFRDDR